MEEVDDDRETALAEDGDCKAKVAEELDGYNYLGLGGDGGQCWGVGYDSERMYVEYWWWIVGAFST